jgi:hypothetical protein
MQFLSKKRLNYKVVGITENPSTKKKFVIGKYNFTYDKNGELQRTYAKILTYFTVA